MKRFIMHTNQASCSSFPLGPNTLFTTFSVNLSFFCPPSAIRCSEVGNKHTAEAANYV